MRQVVGSLAKKKEAASPSEMSRFESGILSSRQNLPALMNVRRRGLDAGGRDGVSMTQSRRQAASAQVLPAHGAEPDGNRRERLAKRTATDVPAEVARSIMLGWPAGASQERVKWEMSAKQLEVCS